MSEPLPVPDYNSFPPDEILFEKHGEIVVITLNNPPYNFMSPEAVIGIDAAMRQFDREPDLRVAILTAAGSKSFSAGGDLDRCAKILSGGGRDWFCPDQSKRFFSDIRKPIICAVNGICTAGGVEMLVGTDIRVAAEHATFGLGEVRWGLVPGGGSHTRLPRQIPWAIAMEILLTGMRITAQRAYDIGLINKVVPADKLMEAAFEYAKVIASNGPAAVRIAKEIVVRSANLEPHFVMEGYMSDRAFATEDAKEGPRAFLEKRPPVFTGR
jgi:enoyl-CoA hydratase